MIRRALERLVPVGVDEWLRKKRLGDGAPAPGSVRLGDLRRTSPISRAFGFDRGTPVDRHYIEAFLARRSNDVRGRALEVGDDGYTRKFGGERVVQRDVLHVSADNPNATIVADLAQGEAIPTGAFDCVILTQTLHLIYDIRSAAKTLRRIVAPGGTCLVTVPGISQIDSGAWRDTWYWAFTTASLRRALGDEFGRERVEVESFGNVLAATAFLYGLASHELTRSELDAVDVSYPVIVAARATVAR